jgi:hypothetical protein
MLAPGLRYSVIVMYERDMTARSYPESCLVWRFRPSLGNQVRFHFISDQQQRRFAHSRQARFDQFVFVKHTQLETEIISPDRCSAIRLRPVQRPQVADVLECWRSLLCREAARCLDTRAIVARPAASNREGRSVGAVSLPGPDQASVRCLNTNGALLDNRRSRVNPLPKGGSKEQQANDGALHNAAVLPKR